MRDKAKWDTVAIVGVGLIGGSIGQALRARGLARHVVGIGRQTSRLQEARRLGAVTACTTRLDLGVKDAEITLVCTPVDCVVRQVREVAEHCPPGALVTDAGSTKARIVQELAAGLPRGVRFVGSHPLAGSEQRGVKHARPDLLVGRPVVVTPGPGTSKSDLDSISRLWRALGAKVAQLPPETHDQVLATTSHVPHLLAAAMVLATSPESLPFTAGGWRDVTRVAGGDPRLWQAIFADNREQVLRALKELEAELAAFRQALGKGDLAALADLLARAQQLRDRSPFGERGGKQRRAAESATTGKKKRAGVRQRTTSSGGNSSK